MMTLGCGNWPRTTVSWAVMRFKQLTLFMAAMSAAGAGVMQFPISRWWIALGALFVTAVMWVVEVRATLNGIAAHNAVPELFPSRKMFWPWLNSSWAVLSLHIAFYALWLAWLAWFRWWCSSRDSTYHRLLHGDAERDRRGHRIHGQLNVGGNLHHQAGPGAVTDLQSGRRHLHLGAEVYQMMLKERPCGQLDGSESCSSGTCSQRDSIEEPLPGRQGTSSPEERQQEFAIQVPITLGSAVWANELCICRRKNRRILKSCRSSARIQKQRQSRLSIERRTHPS